MPPKDHRAKPENDHLTSFEKYERSRFGSHFVISNPYPASQEGLRLNRDAEEAWQLGQQFCREYVNLTASCLFQFSEHLAMSYGWRFGGTHCGYLAGGSASGLASDAVFIRPGNDLLLRSLDTDGKPREWLYKVHFIHPRRPVNAFFERLLIL